MRRLPVYILIETAGGMRGERIEAVKNGLDVMLSKLRQDPFALESVFISLIRFDRTAELVVPLTELELLQIPDISIPHSSPLTPVRRLSFYVNRLIRNSLKVVKDKKVTGDRYYSSLLAVYQRIKKNLNQYFIE